LSKIREPGRLGPGIRGFHDKHEAHGSVPLFNITVEPHGSNPWFFALNTR
jgi:hypothetical protein